MRPEQRDHVPARRPLPCLAYRTLVKRLRHASEPNGHGPRHERAEYREHGFLTLHRTTSAQRWDVTASLYGDTVTLYLNHTRVAVLTPASVTLYADPHMQVRQVRMWLNRVLKDNATAHVVRQAAYQWYVQDKALDPGAYELQRFTNGHTVATPDARKVLAHV